jgi:hypothetical protein
VIEGYGSEIPVDLELLTAVASGIGYLIANQHVRSESISACGVTEGIEFHADPLLETHHPGPGTMANMHTHTHTHTLCPRPICICNVNSTVVGVELVVDLSIHPEALKQPVG